MNSTAEDLRALRDAALTAARRGAAIIRAAGLDGAGTAHQKGRGDYVTEIDRRSEAAVVEELARLTPDVPILAEEQGGDLGHDELWVVDPLDGTTNFIHGFQAVGVSVALLREGRPLAGATIAPFLGDEFTAARGLGAERNGEPVRVAARDSGRAIVSTGFPFRAPERRPRYLRMFGAVMGEIEDLRRVGAASLDLAWTAAGVFDGFFELGLAPWDIAAGALLVEEAGGVVCDWNRGGEWLSTGNIIAGTGRLADLLSRLAAETA